MDAALRLLSGFESAYEQTHVMRWLPGEISVDVPQKAVDLRLAGKAFPRARNIGIQDQQTRNDAASLVTVTEGLKTE